MNLFAHDWLKVSAEAGKGGSNVRRHLERRVERPGTADEARGVEDIADHAAQAAKDQPAGRIHLLQLAAQTEKRPKRDAGNVLDVMQIEDDLIQLVVRDLGQQLPKE